MFSKRSNERLEVDICAIPGWNGFDKLIVFIKNYYAVKVVAKYDGPDARHSILESNGQKIELIHDDVFGNYLVAHTVESEPLVYAIGKDLENRLRRFEDE